MKPRRALFAVRGCGPLNARLERRRMRATLRQFLRNVTPRIDLRGGPSLTTIEGIANREIAHRKEANRNE